MVVLKKKGAEETNALIWVVLALLVVGIFALVYYKFYSNVSEIEQLSPNDKTVAIQLCKVSASLDNSFYCGDFKQLSTGYFSCDYLADQLPSTDVAEWKKEVDCDATYAQNKCKELSSAQGFKKVVIDGKDCEKTPEGKVLWNSNPVEGI